MNYMIIIFLTYLGLSFLVAYFWGRKLQMGFWWALFFMLGFVIGWMIILNDDLTETDPKPEKSNRKIFFGIILMMMSLFIHSTGKELNGYEYLIFTLILLWFFGLGYYLFRKGLITKINQENESQPAPLVPPKQELPLSVVVHYNLTLKENSTCYPVLRIPKKGCTIRSHRVGKTKRKGFTEEGFQKSIIEYFGNFFQISSNLRINTGGRPFEPDIAMIEKKDINNIRIDIEIDEPYAGITRMPAHCNGEDHPRDTYFVDRGWIVIRFSEYQVHTQKIECLKFIAYVIQTIDSQYIFSSDLKLALDLKQEAFWDLLQAQKWEKELHREKYLGHKFGEIPEIENEVDGELNLQERHEERQVQATKICNPDKRVRIGCNDTNQADRDDRINFYPDRHAYVVDGVPFLSVSSMIERYFPVFDPEYWASRLAARNNMTPKALKQQWEDAARKGTFLHQQIENYFLGKELDATAEYHLFEQFLNDHKTLTPYRTEWRIFDEQYRIAGTIDLLAKNGNNFEMYDWKRSKNVVNQLGIEITDSRYHGIGILMDIP